MRTKLYHIRKCISKYNTNFGYLLSLIKIFCFEKCAKTKDSLRNSGLQACLYSDNKYSRTYKFGILADLKAVQLDSKSKVIVEVPLEKNQLYKTKIDACELSFNKESKSQ